MARFSFVLTLIACVGMVVFDVPSEMRVEIIEAPVVLNLETKPDIRTQLGTSNAPDEDTASEKQPNDTTAFQNSQTWNLPEHAIARFGKGVMGGSDRSVAFAPDGKVLASSVRAGTVKLWDTETGANIATLEDAGGPVVFSPDEKMLASGGNVQEVKLWDLETQTDIMTLRGKAGAVFDLTFSPDGTTLVSGNGFGTIKLWDVATGENIATLKGHTGIVFSVDFSPDGKTLASGSQDGTVLLWDPKRIVDR